MKSLEINKQAYGEKHVEYARTLENISIVLRKMGDYEGAKEGYLKSLEIKKLAYGEKHVEFARTI